MKVSRILHAGYVFESGETQIAFDPIFENPFSVNCHAFPSVSFDSEQIKKLRFDAVFISHFHDDHCSFESLNLLDRKTPIYLYCVFEELFEMIKQLGFVEVHSLELNACISIGTIKVTPRMALDADVDSIFHIQADGVNVLNVVDSWIDPSTLEILKRTEVWDLILWPFQTMREIEVLTPSKAEPASQNLPPEWLEQLKILNPKHLVPSSCQFQMEPWSWYNKAFFPVSYQQFETQMQSALPKTEIFRLNPSKSVNLSKEGISSATALSWVKILGEENVDYSYDPNLIPPTTGEIAKHFSALTTEQTKRVYDYCEKELFEKHRSLWPSEDPFFDIERHWQLRIFDHTGIVRDFYYKLDGAKIELTGPSSDIDWTTEIPLAKFYAVLELGESLTSLYLRIDTLADVEVVEDPLIRCLYNGVFGAYQKVQLKRLGF